MVRPARLALIEDAAQAWLSHPHRRPTGSLGDLALFSLYKQVPVADGGVLLARSPAAPPPRRSPLGVRGLAGRHAACAVGRLPLRHPPSWDGFGLSPYLPAQDFALGDVTRGPSRATLHVLRRIAWQGVAETRRRNYRILLDQLRDRVPPPFERIPEGTSPMALPIRTADKGATIGRLARHGLRALDLWSVPHQSLPAHRFPGAAARRASTVGLPVHQGLSSADLGRVSEVARAAT